MHSKQILIGTVMLTSAFAVTSACSKAQPDDAPNGSSLSFASPPPGATVSADERQVYLNAARTSWNLVNRITEPSTGLARAHADYSYVTVWDITGALAATYAAHELGFINTASYDARISRILRTLSTIQLFDRVAFNRIYDAKTTRLVDNAEQLSNVGAGYSSVDIGRLLVWLRIIAVKQPKYAPLATQIVRRLDMSKLLDNGLLNAVEVDPKSGQRRNFHETEIGYQQYALTGFSLWGAKVDNSGLDVRDNVSQVNIFGVDVLTDRRGNDRVMSEPFIMIGLELGYRSPQLSRQAAQVLAAQNARYQKTRIVTAVTEDALPDPPDYFYYYSVWHHGKPFVVEPPGDGRVLDQPRWVSAKAAFAWNALMPSDYTRLLLTTVRPAATRAGWGAGVYERTLRPTGIPSLNTAALIMESALYKIRGRPILSQ
ncbi:MAG: DUF3131 domain-containing protein [Gemmatimonadaceae bacterium]